jgi:ceramide glucosyltransferase
VISVALVTRGKPVQSRGVVRPQITVMKPLCGADAGLEENLESFFAQDDISYELLFGVEDPSDPAVVVVQRLLARHPEQRARLVVHDVRAGVNPKVRNLRGMIAHARHDLVVVSDSNVRVSPTYLSELADEFSRDAHGCLVTNLVRGTGENGLGSALDSVQLAGFCAAGMAGPTLAGEALVMGKSMMFSRRTLDSLGGLDSLSNVLAEDYVMGKMFQHGGYAVRIAPTVIDDVNTGTTLHGFLSRNLRWAMLRFRLRPLAYLLEPLASPLAMLPVAWAAFGPWAVPWALALLFSRDAVQWMILDRGRTAGLPLLLSVLREALSLAVWVVAPFRKHVAWRGTRVRLSSGSVAYATPTRA